jgi:hypothetical protein
MPDNRDIRAKYHCINQPWQDCYAEKQIHEFLSFESDTILLDCRKNVKPSDKIFFVTSNDVICKLELYWNAGSTFGMIGSTE